MRVIDIILCTDNSKNRIINIANEYNNKVTDVIFYLSTILGFKPSIVFKKSLIKSSYSINTNYIKKYLVLLKIKFHKNYYKKILDKYYGPKN